MSGATHSKYLCAPSPQEIAAKEPESMSRENIFRRASGHFAMIYIDREGNLGYEVSTAISNCARSIFSPQATETFLNAVGQSEASGLSECPNGPPIPSTTSVASIAPRVAKKRATRPGRSHITQQGRLNRTAISSSETRSYATAQLPINEKFFLRQYYEKVFENLQQANCRVIAKAYIRLVEPHKQVRYPYNGRKKVNGKIQQFSPDDTKPPWWPIDITHREPDHLPKAERIALLIHILCELRKSHGITARKLKLAGQPVQGQIVPVERLQLLEELYLVREEEEKFLDAVTDGSTSVFISYANLPDSISECVPRLIELNEDGSFISQKDNAVLSVQAMPTLTPQARATLDTTAHMFCILNELDQQLSFANPPSLFPRYFKQERHSAQSGIFPITPVASDFSSPPIHRQNNLL